MTHPRLEAKRASNEPHCANCKYWSARDTDLAVYGMCEPAKITTLDLSVCSAWELHEVLIGRVLRPDEIIDES